MARSLESLYSLARRAMGEAAGVVAAAALESRSDAERPPVRFEAVEEKNFLELDSVGGVGRVDDDGVPAKIFNGVNVGLSEELIG